MFLFRPLIVAALILGGWLGMKAERLLAEGRCREAGGTVGAGFVCVGARAP